MSSHSLHVDLDQGSKDFTPSRQIDAVTPPPEGLGSQVVEASKFGDGDPEFDRWMREVAEADKQMTTDPDSNTSMAEMRILLGLGPELLAKAS